MFDNPYIITGGVVLAIYAILAALPWRWDK
jgi:hypothetical protein